ncbi:hypothetical protein [Algoriphagus aquimarinus]|uniref:Peptidase n=1 Tax=Algoriphagus aquimarinus TaxID=237018 RepID=A0A5C7AP48_9BACT|nr:hypothetical protein [Algoriphagus aquimarinus]TXE07592.1 hypothetical protein ESV85_15465 [Algoriphagus aquimarinus]
MRHKYKVISGVLVLTALVALSFKSDNAASVPTNSPAFSDGINTNIRKAFLEVWQQYKPLHSYGFEVVQEQLSASTMQAQPVIDFHNLFGKKRGYRLSLSEKVLDSEDLIVGDLPEEVLKGWFAHELGHMIDYENHSNAGMIVYGIRYSLSDQYKREREHEADSIAIRHGFREEIIVAKKYLLENDFISPAYQNQISKYYMSIRGAELCPDGIAPVLPKVEI